MATIDSDKIIATMVTDAGLPDDGNSRDLADGALGAALVWFGQEYIAGVSDDWDVELFFDVYGTPPSPIRGWSQRILDGLAFRAEFPAEDRARILDRAQSRAVERLRRDSGTDLRV